VITFFWFAGDLGVPFWFAGEGLAGDLTPPRGDGLAGISVTGGDTSGVSFRFAGSSEVGVD